MSKKFISPVVRIPFVTNNGVHICIISRPRSVLSSNRSNAKVIGADFNVISTVVTIPNPYFHGQITPVFSFDDSQKRSSPYVSEIYWDVRDSECIFDTLKKSLHTLGASSDFSSVLNEIHRSRTLVREAQPLEA